MIDAVQTRRSGAARRTLTRSWGVLACALAGLFAPAAAQAATQTAHAGNVTATYSFQGSFPNYSHQILKITRAGKLTYSAPVTSPLCGTLCGPAGSGRSVHALDLEHNGSPDVVLDLFSGGAHCCTIEQVFHYNASTGRYIKSERNFSDYGARIVDLRRNGRYEFLSGDDRFAYAFTSFAASGLPVQILTFSAGHFHNATRNFPARVAKDAASWLSAYHSLAQSHYQESEGVIAAWAADEELLGHTKLVTGYLGQQAKAGHLNGDRYNGQRFVAALQKFLRRLGYAR